MKIAHYLYSLDPSLGGVVAHVSDLAVLTGEAGAEVRIITPHADPHPGNLDDAAGVELIKVDRPAYAGKVFSRRQLHEVMRQMDGADVIHLHGAWVPANIQIASRAVKKNRRYVVTPHGMLDDWCMSYHAPRKKIFMFLFGRKFFANAERILLCATGEFEQSNKWLGGTPGRVIPAAMDLSPFEVLPGPDLAGSTVAGANTDDPIVLFLSRIHHKKGLEVLIDAAALLARRDRTVRLIVAGTGEDRYVDGLRERIDSQGISDRVVFAGLVRGADKVSLYQRASVLALPTKQENFGLVLTESLAARTPVITTRGVDIWPEIEACNGGLIVDRTPEAFADAIERLLDDPAAADRMGETGREWVMREMRPAVLAEAFMKVYAEACGLGDAEPTIASAGTTSQAV